VSEEDDLNTVVSGIEGFGVWGHMDKIRLFAWLQHHLFKRDRFRTSDINWCYDKLSYESGNTSQLLRNMVGKELLRDGSGYRCEGKFRGAYDAKYGVHQITLNIREMVKNLVTLLPELGQKDIFQEAMICLKHDAGRAAIIMVWNVAFYHLCQFILEHKKVEFNSRIPIRYPRKWDASDIPLVDKYTDFGDEMNEREVIEVANSAGIIDGSMYKVYKEKLDKRNSVAHPSQQHVTQVQAEGFIDDLIQNTIRLLPI
jgi:hypothetical protein